MADDRPFLLYVDREQWTCHDSEGRKRCLMRREMVKHFLWGKGFNPAPKEGLLKLPDTALTERPYVLMITHLDFDPDTTLFQYHKSLERIRGIRQAHPSLPVIVYTGAMECSPGATDYELTGAGVAGIVRKSCDYHIRTAVDQDCVELEKVIDALLPSIAPGLAPLNR